MAPGSVCGTVLVVFGCLFLWGAGKIYSAEKKREGFLACRDCQGEQNRIIDTDMRGWRFRGGAEERQ